MKNRDTVKFIRKKAKKKIFWKLFCYWSGSCSKRDFMVFKCKQVFNDGLFFWVAFTWEEGKWELKQSYLKGGAHDTLSSKLLNNKR